jgi:hypothetical protein
MCEEGCVESEAATQKGPREAYFGMQGSLFGFSRIRPVVMSLQMLIYVDKEQGKLRQACCLKEANMSEGMALV